MKVRENSWHYKFITSVRSDRGRDLFIASIPFITPIDYIWAFIESVTVILFWIVIAAGFAFIIWVDPVVRTIIFGIGMAIVGFFLVTYVSSRMKPIEFIRKEDEE